MIINFEGKKVEFFWDGGQTPDSAVDEICSIMGVKARPELDVIMKDDGETPIHNLGSAVTVDDSALPKCAMTLLEIADWADARLGFYPGIVYDIPAKDVDAAAKNIIISADSLVDFLKMIIEEGHKEFELAYNSMCGLFLVLGLDADKNETIEISGRNKDVTSATIIRDGKRTVGIDMVNKTISANVENSKECAELLALLNSIGEDKFKIVPAAGGSSEVVENPDDSKTVVITNTANTEVLCNTEQIVTRIDMKKIFSRVHVNSFNKLNLPVEDKAHVMQRLEAAITSIDKDVKAKEKYFGKAHNIKYGMMQKLYKSKDNFILTNGKRFWKFTENGYSNFFDTLDEAVKYNGEEAAASA